MQFNLQIISDVRNKKFFKVVILLIGFSLNATVPRHKEELKTQF